ncbi:MAG: hypothetical protein WCF98_05830 [Synechococcus sp. ELA057]|jgi:hypothetical protein
MTGNPAHLPTLLQLEAEARRRDLVLRLKVGRPLGLLWTLQAAVARRRPPGAAGGAGALELLGDLKSWALPSRDGLRLDTMRVQGEGTAGVGWLLWSATFAWSLEATPCRRATLLAIRDGEQQHRRLVRYFRQLGFEPWRELGAAPADLPARLQWGGAGLLMQGDCSEGLRRTARRLGLGGGGSGAC